MFDKHYRVIFRHLGAYYHADNRAPDRHEGPFDAKVSVGQNARAMLREAESAPSAVLDLTTSPEAELREYLP